MNAKNIRLIKDLENIAFDKVVDLPTLRKELEDRSTDYYMHFMLKDHSIVFIAQKGRIVFLHNSFTSDGKQYEAYRNFDYIPEVKPTPKAQPKRFAWDSERRCIVGVY